MGAFMHVCMCMLNVCELLEDVCLCVLAWISFLSQWLPGLNSVSHHTKKRKREREQSKDTDRQIEKKGRVENIIMYKKRVCGKQIRNKDSETREGERGVGRFLRNMFMF